jgi:hypothetical protein
LPERYRTPFDLRQSKVGLAWTIGTAAAGGGNDQQ